ncbi:MAG TPA: ABC transporter permease [Dongiaceae bacterium]|jgi:peptide/nickel transport system permease protein|nr:ABC transporter permease [Dongiaceae bacterium]
MASLSFLIGKRIAYGLVALWLLLTFIFFAATLLPGDLANLTLGREATPEALAQFRAMLGLDKPLYVQYFHWLLGAVQGDFGISLATQRPISELVFERLGNTLFLGALAAMIAVPLALMLGILTALFRDSIFDRAANVMTLSAISFPDFFVAYILILFLSVKLNIFPSIADVNPETPFSERVYTTLLPALTLVLFVTAHMMRMTRATLIDLLGRPYIETAQLKGLSRARIIVVHALANAWAPIVNVVVFNLAYLMLGVVIVEVVFAYPGLGQLLVDSVAKRDIPLVQASCLIFAATYLLLNLVADIFSVISNPRLRYPR